jgi:hypothetical protein
MVFLSMFGVVLGYQPAKGAVAHGELLIAEEFRRLFSVW